MSLLATITNSPLLSAIVFLIGIGLVIFSVEEFVEHVSTTAVSLGVSTFFLTVVLAGTDLENTILGGAAVLGNRPTVALGTVFGEAVFILCLALGLGSVIVPFEIETPLRYLALTGLSPVVLVGLSLDGTLSRFDGAVLLSAFIPAIALLYHWEQTRSIRHLRAEESREDGPPRTTESEEERRPLVRFALLGITVVGMVVGSELAVQGTKGLLAYTGIVGLAFGATILSIIASLEEILLTVEPVRDGRPAVATGNIVGSMIFFVTANVGLLALIQPLAITPSVWTIQFPFVFGTLLIVLAVLYRGTVSRPIGMGLLVLYGLYWAVNYRY